MSSDIIIAYDFFDTIVHRDCHPEEVLYQWSKHVSMSLDFKISPSELYTLRKETECRLKESDSIEELKYEELIKNVFLKIPNKNISMSDFISLCYNCELDIEKSHIYLDSNCVHEIFNHKKNGKHLIVISDFYIGKGFFEYILKELKLEGVFSELFISSDLNKRKSTGSLYKHVLNYFQIEPDKLFMVGDNYKSDVLIPDKLGIHVTYREYNNPNHLMNVNEFRKEIDNTLFSCPNSRALSGYAGELIYFVSLLFKELRQLGVETVLFCSREGQFLKKLFDLYQESWGNTSIKTKYLYVSRKAVLAPSLDQFDKEQFNMIFRQYKSLMTGDFLNSIGFTEAEILCIFERNEELINSEFSIDNLNPAYQYLLSNEYFQNLYEEKRINQKRLFLKYLKELGCTLNHERIYIVDIGWKGTIQDCIQCCLPKDCTVEGFYLGINSTRYGCINNELKHGLLFSDYPNASRDFGIFEHDYMFYERIFSANHGPVLRYEENDDGRVFPVINDIDDELALYNYIKPYQENLFFAFKHLVEVFKRTQWEPYELYELMVNNLLWRQCVYSPKIWRIEANASEKNRENFGELSNQKKIEREKGIEKFKKVNYMHVSVVYKFLDKFHLKILYPLGEVYCRLVFLLKKNGRKCNESEIY